ncbi:MAG: hypothetical protein RIQ93_711 [Verrucomicrobiota bacterium]|jgi:uncharacterized RDD family membrane protein YckC
MKTSVTFFLLAGCAAWFLSAPIGRGAQAPAPPPPAAIETPPEPAAPRAPTPPKARRDKAREHEHTGDVLINIFNDSTQPSGRASDAVVSIFGSSTADGEVREGVVSIFGNTCVSGTVGEAAVAVLGDVFVNGLVKGNVVAVFGDVELGPKAEVEGQIVCVGGSVRRDANAVVAGNVQNIGLGRLTADHAGLTAWIEQCLLWGRPLAFGPHLAWAWAIAGAFLAFYVALALLFRGGLEQCIRTLDARPGGTAIAALLTVFLTPGAMVLLVVTGVGILLVPVAAGTLFFGSLFGVAAVLGWLGRKGTRRLGRAFGHPALAVLLAGLAVLGLYTIPVLGFLLMKMISWLGLGVVAFTALLAIKHSRPAPVAPAPAPDPSQAGFGNRGYTAGAPESTAVPPVFQTFPGNAPPQLSANLPRAGFWIRLAALLLDVVLLGLIAALLTGGPQLALLGVAAYAAVLWKLKGTTIGGTVCGLKVVRLDDRPIDWGTAVVRVLGCFLSLAVAGLGFIWVAVDDQRQSWHDKIAGTTVVRVPRGVSLI